MLKDPENYRDLKQQYFDVEYQQFNLVFRVLMDTLLTQKRVKVSVSGDCWNFKETEAILLMSKAKYLINAN